MSSKNETNELKAAAKASEGVVRGIKGFHSVKGHNLQLKTGTKGVVSLIDESAKSSKWIARLDKPHVGHHTYHHINLNKAHTGMPDPHIRVPEAAFRVYNFSNFSSLESSSYNFSN